MDEKKFDRLTVAVGKLRDRVSRRDALRAVVGGALGIAVAEAVGETEARKRKHRKSCKGNNARCSRNRDCCSGFCVAGLCRRSGSGGGGCNGRNEFCNRDRDCCSGYCLNNICIGGGGGGGGCGGQGSFCDRDNDCCSLNCISNVCIGGGGGGCGGQGDFCDRDNDCCSGDCIGGICFGNGGGGGSCRNCGNNRCCNGVCAGNNFRCCQSGSGIGAICPIDMTCCAGDTGAGCCVSGGRCCDRSLGGGCCPPEFRCGNNGQCVLYQTSKSGVQTAKVIPQTPRVTSLRDDQEAAPSGESQSESGGTSKSKK